MNSEVRINNLSTGIVQLSIRKRRSRSNQLTSKTELNRQLARLERLRGINSGELYTWSGRYKALMRDYAFPLFMW
jgi:hypothetical protein